MQFYFIIFQGDDFVFRIVLYENRTASGYVEIKNLTDNQTLIVGSQNAGKVNVTLSNENGIIGRLEK